MTTPCQFSVQAGTPGSATRNSVRAHTAGHGLVAMWSHMLDAATRDKASGPFNHRRSHHRQNSELRYVKVFADNLAQSTESRFGQTLMKRFHPNVHKEMEDLLEEFI